MKKGLLLLFVLLSAIGLRAQDAVVGDTLTAAEVTALENGKTYVLGKQYDMCKVSFTAPADGFLSITPSQKVNSTSLKINGASSTFTFTDGRDKVVSGGYCVGSGTSASSRGSLDSIQGRHNMMTSVGWADGHVTQQKPITITMDNCCKFLF